MNFDRLRFVAERAEVGEAREALLAVTIPERPGAFREFCAALGRRVVTEFNYRLSGRDAGAHLRRRRHAVAPGRRGAGRAAARRAATRPSTSPTTRWRSCTSATWSAAARPTCATSGCAGSSFPSGPGALTQFLEKLGGRWNISLFHYRNHGADFGRVLAGFEVEDDGSAGVPRVPRRARLSVHGRAREPGVQVLPLTSGFGLQALGSGLWQTTLFFARLPSSHPHYRTRRTATLAP